MVFRENVQRTVSAIDQLLLTIIAENNEIGNQYRIPTWVENSPLLNGLSVQVAISGPDGVTVASTLGRHGKERYFLTASPSDITSIPLPRSPRSASR